MRWCLPRAAVLLGAALLLAPAPAQAGAPRLGLADDLAFSDARPVPRVQAYQRARGARARLLRLTLDWSRVAPGGAIKPAGFHASDPAAPQYNFSYIEDEVRDASRRGLGVILTVVNAPRWAEAGDKPAGSAPGAWRPDPGELASFVRAAARRFSGFYPDPKAGSGDPLLGGGGVLPHVRYWQIWSEPNGNRTLQPVFERGRLAAAAHYRRMLNASAKAVKAVDGGNVIVTAGTSARRGVGAAPLAFWRGLLCLTRAGHRARCPERASFDVAAHDPITERRPSARLGRDEVGLSQLPRLRRLVGRAVKLHTVVPARRKPLWLTALSWETPPLAPEGVSLRAQATFLAEGLYRAQRAGASVVIWSGLQDRLSYPGSFPTVRSGLYHDESLGSRPKPSLAAYRFPFVVRGARGGSLAWGMAPHRGRVAIQRRSRGRWRTVEHARASRSRGFTAHFRPGRGLYRARQGRAVSPNWRR